LPHPSLALSNFQATVAVAERLAQIESRYRDPPHAGTAPTVEALRGGFCVLIVGGFERFLSEAFDEHLGLLVGTPPPVAFQDLPEKLRLSSVFESLDFAMTGPRRGAQKKGRAARFPDVASAARRIVLENIDPTALSQTKGNPNGATVRAMFSALGTGDPFTETRPAFNASWPKPESSTFVSDKLEEIVNARHVVAHTASALTITRSDLADWPAFLRVLATVLDQRVDRYVTNVLALVSPP
jgi:hypothetical protein